MKIQRLYLSVYTICILCVGCNQSTSTQVYPQIIQANDYETIVTIEAYFQELNNGKSGEVSCSIATSAIGKIKITERNSEYLFTTLNEKLTEYAKTKSCILVKFDQFQTRAYEKRTIIEYGFGKDVIVLDAYSNGPQDEDRLYVLDAIKSDHSFFWSM